MVLTHLLLSAQPDFGYGLTAFHLHHGMRIDADSDVQFLKKTMNEWKIPLQVEYASVPEYARENRISIEEAGRILRYQGLRLIKEQYKQAYIVTGHNADDLAETVFYRLLTGVGIRGLEPMKILDGDLLRPILPFYRNEIEQYAHQENINFMVDSTNFDLKYKRNYIRHKLFPELAKLNSGFKEHLVNLTRDTSEVDEYLQRKVIEVISSVIEEKENHFIIQLEYFNPLPSVIKKRVLMHLFERKNEMVNRKMLERIITLAGKPRDGQVNLFKDFIAKKSGKYLYLFLTKPVRPISKEDGLCYELTVPGKLIIPETGQILTTEYSIKPVKENSHELFLPAGSFCLPLMVRSRQKGDSIRLSRLKGKSRKIQDIFVDNKIESSQRDWQLLVTDTEKILWVIGLEKPFIESEGQDSGIIITCDRL
ncbi:MAG: tRNA(Ile)-lysidine synthase [candidate division WS2 bacterium]|nr:tRNA(Ile)-lysidine synthase [Candidatus Lithacetigena glycinireducens]